MTAARVILFALPAGLHLPGTGPRSRCRRSPAASSTRPARYRAGDIASLTDKLKDLETRKGSQIAVLIVPTIGEETIEQFSIRVAEAWKIGRKKVDDGALLVVAKNDRRLRIEVGYGLEGVLSDAVTHRIIDEDITPKFKAGDFAGGISAGVDRMIGLDQRREIAGAGARALASGAIEAFRCEELGAEENGCASSPNDLSRSGRASRTNSSSSTTDTSLRFIILRPSRLFPSIRRRRRGSRMKYRARSIGICRCQSRPSWPG